LYLKIYQFVPSIAEIDEVLFPEPSEELQGESSGQDFDVSDDEWETFKKSVNM
jgi:hypothetical protein